MAQGDGVPLLGGSGSVGGGQVAPAAEAGLSLSLADLLPDANGEIVVFSAGDWQQLSILTEDKVAGSGLAGSHQTLDGVDVTGLQFVTLESGTTLYYPHSVELAVVSPTD